MAYSDNSAVEFNAPFFVGCLFGTDEELEAKQREEAAKLIAHLGIEAANVYGKANPCDYNTNLYYETRPYRMLNASLSIRQFDDHPTNANCVWPEAAFLAEWLTGIGVDDNDIPAKPEDYPDYSSDPVTTSVGLASPNFSRLHSLIVTADAFTYQGRNRKRVLELGSATGALAIFLAKHGVDITSSDLDDPTVTENIAHNFRLNGLTPQHLVHSWGRNLPDLESHLESTGYYDIILGSDILAYEDSFPDLATTLNVLIPPWNRSTVMYMVWKRRHKRKTENIFFDLLKQKGFAVKMNRQRVYVIRREVETVPETVALGPAEGETNNIASNQQDTLVLIPFSDSQDARMKEILSDPDTMKHLKSMAPGGVGASQNWTDQAIKERRERFVQEQKEGKRVQFAIALRSPAAGSDDEKLNPATLPGDRVIGMCGLSSIEYFPLSRSELGLIIDAAFHRQKLGTKIIYRLLTYAFETLKLREIRIRTEQSNEPCNKLMEKLGLERQQLDAQQSQTEQTVWIEYRVSIKGWPAMKQKIQASVQ